MGLGFHVSFCDGSSVSGGREGGGRLGGGGSDLRPMFSLAFCAFPVVLLLPVRYDRNPYEVMPCMRVRLL